MASPRSPTKKRVVNYNANLHTSTTMVPSSKTMPNKSEAELKAAKNAFIMSFKTTKLQFKELLRTLKDLQRAIFRFEKHFAMYPKGVRFTWDLSSATGEIRQYTVDKTVHKTAKALLEIALTNLEYYYEAKGKRNAKNAGRELLIQDGLVQAKAKVLQFELPHTFPEAGPLAAWLRTEPTLVSLAPAVLQGVGNVFAQNSKQLPSGYNVPLYTRGYAIQSTVDNLFRIAYSRMEKVPGKGGKFFLNDASLNAFGRSAAAFGTDPKGEVKDGNLHFRNKVNSDTSLTTLEAIRLRSSAKYTWTVKVHNENIRLGQYSKGVPKTGGQPPFEIDAASGRVLVDNKFQKSLIAISWDPVTKAIPQDIEDVLKAENFIIKEAARQLKVAKENDVKGLKEADKAFRQPSAF
jgi:hypothetical protein